LAESSPIRILVVDDERFSLAVIEASLNGIDDCVVETCRSGEDAFESAAAFKPDLLILSML
jgi:CheY-like chemotaxis protein